MAELNSFQPPGPLENQTTVIQYTEVPKRAQVFICEIGQLPVTLRCSWRHRCEEQPRRVKGPQPPPNKDKPFNIHIGLLIFHKVNLRLLKAA